MKILFLCGSAEPGKDGVGDYTRRLCGELIRRGHHAQMLSLCDKYSGSFVSQTQIVEKTAVVASRIPIAASYLQRLTYVQDIVQGITPDWISIQFVPYSFHPKGLPFWLPNFLKKIKGAHQWHVMFHELWVGMDTNASFKNRCYSFLQKKIVFNILKNIKNIIINTHANLYQQEILKLGYNSNLLALFSNISNNNLNEAKKNIKKTTQIRFAMFGGIHFGAPIQQFIDELKLELKKRKGYFLKFFFIGNCGNSIKEWTLILDAENIEYEIFGYCSDQEISEKLVMCDYGVSTTPYLLIQKSGSVAALLEHYLPVLCVARKWEVSILNADKEHKIYNVFDFKDNGIQKLFNQKIEINKINTLTSVTDSLLENLNTN